MYPLTAIDRSDDRVATAMDLAERAVFAGPEVDFCLRTRGNLKFWLLRDHESAINDCNRALAITPNYQLAHLTRLQSELFSGDWRAARHRLDRQIEVDIALPQYHYFQTLYALCALAAGDDTGARKHALEAYEYAPWSDWGVLTLAAAYGDETPGSTTGITDRLARCSLTPDHFRDLPIRDASLLATLIGRAEQGGF
jgi:tetratricopeptide (TPR) repeat protein